MVECELPKLNTWVRFPSPAVLLLGLLLLSGCTTARGPVALSSAPLPVRSGGIYHRVQRGETLWRISKAYHITLDQLVHANRLQSSHQIEVGQPLWIPGATTPHSVALPTPAAPSSQGFIWPVTGKVVQHFGTETEGSTNRGMDIHVHHGAAVRAVRNGRVVFVDDAMPGYGQTVLIDHGDEFHTVYAWNRSILVQVGQYVTQSTQIATANATVHFEIRRGHTPHNPLYFLP